VAIRTASTLIIGPFVVTGFTLVDSDSPKAHLALGLAEAFVGDALRAHLRCEHCPEDVQSQPKTAKVAMSDASVASAACVRIVPLRMRSCVR